MIVASREVQNPAYSPSLAVMIHESFFVKRFLAIISGEDVSFGASVIRFPLRILSVLHRIGLFFRNTYYRTLESLGLLPRAGCPVISVGNLSFGGTGKTPMVIWLAGRLSAAGLRVVILSRGYGAKNPGGKNDEAQEIERFLPEIPHLQSPDRVSAAREAVSRFHPDVILLDDGFQYRRLFRDVNIVLLDVTQCPVFSLFPAGLLREPVSALRRADIVVLTRTNFDAKNTEFLKKTTAQYSKKDALCFTAAYHPVCFEDTYRREYAISDFRGKKNGVLCGIGNPHAFLRTLEAEGVINSPPPEGWLRNSRDGFGHVVIQTTSPSGGWESPPHPSGTTPQEGNVRIFPDHFPFFPSDIQKLEIWAKDGGFDAIFCTWKDLVKLNRETLGGVPVYALRIEMEISEPERFLERIRQIMER